MFVAGCVPHRKIEVIASHPRLRFGAQMQAPWTPQLEVVANVIAATTNGMVAAWLGDFAVAVAAVNLGDAGGSQGRTVV